METWQKHYIVQHIVKPSLTFVQSGTRLRPAWLRVFSPRNWHALVELIQTVQSSVKSSWRDDIRAATCQKPFRVILCLALKGFGTHALPYTSAGDTYRHGCTKRSSRKISHTTLHIFRVWLKQVNAQNWRVWFSDIFTLLFIKIYICTSWYWRWCVHRLPHRNTDADTSSKGPREPRVHH